MPLFDLRRNVGLLGLGGLGGGAGGGGFIVPASASIPFADIAARNAWAAASLSDLVQNQTVVSVAGTPDTWFLWRGTTDPASHDPADWSDVTPILTGNDGADGVSFAEFESEAARDASFSTAAGRAQLRQGLPIIININGTVIFQIWDGGDTPATYDPANWQDASLGTTPGSVTLGNIRISSGGNALFLENLGTGRVYVAQGGEVDLTTGSVAANNVPVLGAEAANTPQPADDVTITAQTSQFTITATIDQVLTRYSLWFAAATPDVQIRVYDGPNNTDPIIIEIRQDMAMGENQLVFPSNPRFEPGRQYLTEYSTTSPQLNLMGSNVGPGSSFFPRFQSYGLPYSEVTSITSASSVTQLADISDAGSGAIISDAERTKLAGVADGANVYTDEQVRDVVGATLVAGMNVDITVNDAGDTITISATGGNGGGTNPPANADFIYYGLSNVNNPGTVDLATLTREDNPTDPDTISTGLTTANQYFILLVPMADDVTSIFDTVLNQDVTSIFNETDNVRVIETIAFKSYVLGPLNASVNEQYIINF